MFATNEPQKNFMNIKEVIKQPEGRRLEFKEILPENADLANTIIAFANDAGGELYLGVRNNPREITGLPEEDLVKIEEQISNIIFDRCYPAILPDITFLTEDDKHIIRVTVHRGSAPPYYQKDKGKLKGTYIRVGSSSRLADEEIISELESRQSDARNKIIAPVFKRMGIIDQWGNGLKLIADELKEYPQIEFRWKETGLSFQVQFVKLNYVAEQELQQELQGELNNPTMYSEVLRKILEIPLSRKEISDALGQKQISGQLSKILSKLIEDKLVENTIQENKNHPKQKLRITKRGAVFLELLKT